MPTAIIAEYGRTCLGTDESAVAHPWWLVCWLWDGLSRSVTSRNLSNCESAEGRGTNEKQRGEHEELKGGGRLTGTVLGSHVGDEKIDCDQAWGHFDCTTLPREAIWAII